MTLNEIQKIIYNASHNKTTEWKEMTELLMEQVKKANSITDLVGIAQSLVYAIGEKQCEILNLIADNKTMDKEFKEISEENEQRKKENFKLKELIGLEQFKNKCLLDKFEFLTKKRYQVIIKELKED